MSIKRAITRPVIRSVVSDAIRADRRFVPYYDGVSAYSSMTAKVPLSAVSVYSARVFRASAGIPHAIMSGDDWMLIIRSSSPASTYLFRYRNSSSAQVDLQFSATILAGEFDTVTLKIDTFASSVTLTAKGASQTLSLPSPMKTVKFSDFGRNSSGLGGISIFHGYIYDCWMKDVYRLQDRYVRYGDGVSCYGQFATPVVIPASTNFIFKFRVKASTSHSLQGVLSLSGGSSIFVRLTNLNTASPVLSIRFGGSDSNISLGSAFFDGESSIIEVVKVGTTISVYKNYSLTGSVTNAAYSSGLQFDGIYRLGSGVQFCASAIADLEITINGVVTNFWALDESSGSTSVDTVGGNTLTWVNPTTPTYLAKFDSYWPGDEPSGTTIRDRCGVSDLTTVNVTRTEISV